MRREVITRVANGMITRTRERYEGWVCGPWRLGQILIGGYINWYADLGVSLRGQDPDATLTVI
jgi:hypothetical protein